MTWLYLVLPIAMLLAPNTGKADIVFSDGEFDNADWSTAVVTNLYGGSLNSAAQVSPGGNPGNYREIAITLNSVPNPPQPGSAVFTYHYRTGAVADPSSVSFSSISYQEDAICVSGSFGCSVTGPLLLQNGQTFLYRKLPLLDSAAHSWEQKNLTGLTADDFCVLDFSQTTLCDDEAAVHPDFSSAGPPVQFGFYRAISAGSGGGGFTWTSGIDNWSITVIEAPAVPASSIGTRLLLGVLLVGSSWTVALRSRPDSSGSV